MSPPHYNPLELDYALSFGVGVTDGKVSMSRQLVFIRDGGSEAFTLVFAQGL